MNFICCECGDVLSDEERHYYEDHCEKCEGEWHARIVNWRTGQTQDTELDDMYSGPKPVNH